MYNFIGHDNWKDKFNIDETILNVDVYEQDNKLELTVLRNINFLYAEQKTTLERIRAHFTNLAIDKMVNDKFIKIH